MNEFEGQLLGNVKELFGSDAIIEIDEQKLSNRNISLTINKVNNILCSSKLSNYIRDNALHERTNELKNFAVYEFPNYRKYIIFSTDNNLFNERAEKLKEVQIVFMDFFEEYLQSIQNIKLSKAERLKFDIDYEEKTIAKTTAIEKINKNYEGLL